LNIRIIQIILMIALFYGCEPITNSIEPEKFSVAALITNNAASQRIQIFRTASLNEQNDDPNYYFIESAKITVEADDTSEVFYVMVSSANGNYYRPSEPTEYEPNKKYTLNIITDFGNASGSTTLPGQYSITEPNENDAYKIIYDQYIKYVEINLKWTESNNSYGYIINLSYAVNQNGEKPTYVTFAYLTKKTAYDINVQIPDNFVFNKPIIISIMAFDINYYNHLFRNISNAGLEGAVGYLGSAVIKSVNVFVEEQ